MEDTFSPKAITKKRLFTPVRNFLNDSRSGEVILIICTLTSLILSNHASSRFFITPYGKTGFLFLLISFIYLKLSEIVLMRF